MIMFNAERLSSGVYIVRMEAGDFTALEKIQFVK